MDKCSCEKSPFFSETFQTGGEFYGEGVFNPPVLHQINKGLLDCVCKYSNAYLNLVREKGSDDPVSLIAEAGLAKVPQFCIKENRRSIKVEEKKDILRFMELLVESVIDCAREGFFRDSDGYPVS